ncbi:30S ribosomal protein S6e [Sulfolobales archaeon HS-7]|nr:30S ribosomal protein S6e [Sulfolobales archaeon HS-7]
MADFKIVISDPETKNDKKIKCKVISTEEVNVLQGEKEGKALPIAKINEKTHNQIGSPQFITIQTEKEGDKKEKIKVHFKAVIDNKTPDNVIYINKEIAEKFGKEEFDGEVYRAKSFQINMDQSRASSLVNMKIGEQFDGTIIGLPELKLRITGGSDNSGFPMRSDVLGGVKKKILLSGPPGYYPAKPGERRRKLVRGNLITPDIVQINTVIVRG